MAIQSLRGYRNSKDDWIWSSIDPAEVARKILEISQDSAQARALVVSQQLVVAERFRSEVMASKYIVLYNNGVPSSRESKNFGINQVKIT